MDDVSLTKALAAILGEIPGWWWSETDPPPGGEVKIFYGPIGSDPDRAVGVRLYDTADSPLDHLSGRFAQLRFRGDINDPAGADALAHLAFAKITGLSRRDGILVAFRQSFARLGADSSGRDERSDNYIIQLDNEEALL